MEDLVTIKTPDPIYGQLGVCHFNLRPINGIWHADVMFIESKIGERENIQTVPWREIKFLNDPKDERKNGYMSDHIKVARKKIVAKIVEIYQQEYQAAKKEGKIKNLLTADVLNQKLVWMMN